MTSGRVNWEDYFKNIAKEVTTRSTCNRKHVGAVIVRNKTILATGYNDLSVDWAVVILKGMRWSMIIALEPFTLKPTRSYNLQGTVLVLIKVKFMLRHLHVTIVLN